MADVRELIRQLGNFRSRSAAMEDLLLLGETAVDPLIAALGSPLEGTRYAAATTLGRLGDERALDALDGVRDDPVAGDAARKSIAALRALRAGPTTTAGAGAPSADELLEAVVRGQPMTLPAGEGSARTLRVTLPDGRAQLVRVDFGVTDDDGERLVVAFTTCGPARPELFEEALRYNMKMRFGAVGLVDIGGQPTFVMVDTHRRTGLAAEALRRSVRELAARGDAMEKALTGEDRR